jgi:hypothetical protein
MPDKEKKRTFANEAVERMKSFFIKNARTNEDERLDCITTMNTGLRLLLGMPRHPVGSAVHKTMNSLRRTGHATEPYIIEFLDEFGQKTIGVKRPEELIEPISAAILEMAGREPGWSVFGLSIMDGYHSVTLTLDLNDPGKPRIYWSDQWSSHDGWYEYGLQSLDEEITDDTQQWWDDFEPARKPRTRATLWRVLP